MKTKEELTQMTLEELKEESTKYWNYWRMVDKIIAYKEL
jgi:hypothetical protein